jgi:hypothetical protein
LCCFVLRDAEGIYATLMARNLRDGQINARTTDQISDADITSAPETIPMACTGCFSSFFPSFQIEEGMF